MRIFAGLLLALVWCSPAYAQKACTEIGCTNGITLSVDPGYDWKNGNYHFYFALDNRKVHCWGELPLNACGEPSLMCDKQGFVAITESGCALPPSAHGFGDIYINDDPRKLLVRIVQNNRTIVTRTIIPKYKTSMPNGPGCGPVCKSAVYDLFYAQ